MALFYWRDRHAEVDFVLQCGDQVIGIEVKSGKIKETLPGMKKFREQFKPHRILLVGGQGIGVETFLRMPIESLFL